MSMISTLQQFAGERTHKHTKPKTGFRRDTADQTLNVDDVKVTTYTDLTKIADEWKAFDARCGACLFQSYLWVDAWNRTSTGQPDEETIIAVGRNQADDILFIWPLATQIISGVKMLTWAGQSHSNYNFSLFDPEFAKSLTPRKLNALLHAVASSVPGIAAAYFQSQPITWEGRNNPFSSLPHYASPNSAYMVNLSEGFDHVFDTQLGKTSRRNLKRKEKKLRSFGDIKIERAEGLYVRLDIIEQFFAQKTKQFAEAGIKNIFADPELKAFYRDLITGTDGKEEDFELYYFKINDHLAATFNGITYQGRFYLLLASMTQEEYSRWSPGLILMRHHIEHCADKGRSVYDLGTGGGAHKSMWTNEEDALFDTFIPFTMAGRILSGLFLVKTAVKRFVKNNAKLWSLTKTMRQKLGQLRWTKKL